MFYCNLYNFNNLLMYLVCVLFNSKVSANLSIDKESRNFIGARKINSI